MQKSKPVVVAMIGPVGSGKTFIAKVLSKALGLVHIRTDDLRVADRRRGGRVSRNIIPIIRHPLRSALAKGKSVVLDADFVNPETRRRLEKITQTFGARLFYIYVWAPESLILTRLRKHRYTKNDLFQNYREAIRVYFMRKRWHQRVHRLKNLFVIKNNRPLKPQLSKIVKVIKGR